MKSKVTVEQLNQRVEVEEKIPESDEQGGFTDQWVPYLTIWAHVVPLLPLVGDEIWRVGEHFFSSRYSLWMRGEVPLKPGLRFRWKESLLYPVSMAILIDNGRFQIVLTEKEGSR